WEWLRTMSLKLTVRPRTNHQEPRTNDQEPTTDNRDVPKQKSLPFGRLFSEEKAGGAGPAFEKQQGLPHPCRSRSWSDRMGKHLLCRSGRARTRSQLLKVVFHQADFNPSAAHALRLCAGFSVGSFRSGSVAHADHIDPVNRDLVVLDEVTNNR